jgi:hypothetical protein
MRDHKFGPWEAACGFAVLAVVFAGEVALILGSGRASTIPLPHAAQLMQRIFFGH